MSKENEHLSKIALLEQRVASLLSDQRHLEAVIEGLRDNHGEEELKVKVEGLERSERALIRKIEILQQSDYRKHQVSPRAHLHNFPCSSSCSSSSCCCCSSSCCCS